MKIDLILDANGAYASAIFLNVGLKPVGIFLLVGISDIRNITDFYGTASSSKNTTSAWHYTISQIQLELSSK